MYDKVGRDSTRRRMYGAVRWRWTVSGMAAVAAAVLALSAPLAAGQVAHGPVILIAPYSGTTSSPSWSSSIQGCAHATIVVKPAFHPIPGRGVLAIQSSSTVACSSLYGSSSSVSGSMTANVPIPIHHKNSVVSVIERLTAWVAAHIAAVNCTVANTSGYSYCDEYAYSSVYLYSYVTDTTTGNTWFGGIYFAGFSQSTYNDKYCYNSSCYTYTSSNSSPNQRSTTFLDTINVTGANTADSFVLVWALYAYAYSAASLYHASMPGASASAIVNAANNHNGATLSSISVS